MRHLLLLGTVPALVFGKPTFGSMRLALGRDGALRTVSETHLYAVNTDGSTKWIFAANDWLNLFAEGLNGTVYTATFGGATFGGEATLFSLDSLDGSVMWKHQLDSSQHMPDDDPCPMFGSGGPGNPDQIEGHPLAVASDGTVYLTSSTSFGRVTTTIDAINTTGAVTWTYTNANCASLSAVGADGTLFVSSAASLDALQPETGAVKWSVAPIANGTRSPDGRQSVALAKNGDIFILQIVSEGDSVLLSVSNEGSVRWNHTSPELPKLHHPPGWMILSSNNDLYVNGVTLQDGTCSLRVFDLQGNNLRDLPCLGSQSQYSKEGDTFVTVLEEGKVLMHSGTDGRLLWEVSLPDELSPYLKVASFGRNGTVFVQSAGYNETVFALQNGKVAWTVQTDEAGTPLELEDGTTYIDGGDRDEEEIGIVAVGADGVEKWRHKLTEADAVLV